MTSPEQNESLARDNHFDAPRALRRTSDGASRHDVQFYDGEAYLVESLSSYLADGLIAGQRCFGIVTEPHAEEITTTLARRGFDVARAIENGQLRLLDAQLTLDSLMNGDSIDADRFRTVIWPLVEHRNTRNSRAPIRACGEMVNLLAQNGNLAAAMSLEALWNELAAAQAIEILCVYAMTSFASASDTEAFGNVCGRHAHVLQTEAFTSSTKTRRLLDIARLQQRARSLDVEVEKRETLERRLVEITGELERLRRRPRH